MCAQQVLRTLYSATWFNPFCLHNIHERFLSAKTPKPGQHSRPGCADISQDRHDACPDGFVMKSTQYNMLTFIKRKSYPPGELNNKAGVPASQNSFVHDCNGHAERAHVICVNYLRGRIYRNSDKEKLIHLQRIAGNDLNSLFMLEEYIEIH